MTRTHTPPRTTESGSTIIKVQRACNGCHRSLGDATDIELDAAMNGEPLPDVRAECGCAPTTEPVFENVHVLEQPDGSWTIQTGPYLEEPDAVVRVLHAVDSEGRDIAGRVAHLIAGALSA